MTTDIGFDTRRAMHLKRRDAASLRDYFECNCLYSCVPLFSPKTCIKSSFEASLIRLKDLNFRSRVSLVFGPTPGMVSKPDFRAPFERLFR